MATDSSAPDSPTSVLKRIDDYTRREPAKAVATGFSVGLVLQLLPLGAIVGVFISLALTMARPILLVLGILKLVDLCALRSTSHHD